MRICITLQLLWSRLVLLPVKPPISRRLIVHIQSNLHIYLLIVNPRVLPIPSTHIPSHPLDFLTMLSFLVECLLTMLNFRLME